jgi:hypothetical protein
MWFVNFRFAEIILIAAEASMELGNQSDAVMYINQIRSRAGIQPLTSVTLDDIVRENRVEFAFENHRYWDLKRWRLAHILWNGIEGDPNATHYALFPYVINQPGNPANGKWVFDKQKAHMSVYPRYFQMKNYYNFLIRIGSTAIRSWLRTRINNLLTVIFMNTKYYFLIVILSALFAGCGKDNYDEPGSFVTGSVFITDNQLV